MDYDLRQMAQDIIRQHLVECFEDIDFVGLASDDPDAGDLLHEEFDRLVDNMKIVQVDIRTRL